MLSRTYLTTTFQADALRTMLRALIAVELSQPQDVDTLTKPQVASIIADRLNQFETSGRETATAIGGLVGRLGAATRDGDGYTDTYTALDACITILREFLTPVDAAVAADAQTRVDAILAANDAALAAPAPDAVEQAVALATEGAATTRAVRTPRRSSRAARLLALATEAIGDGNPAGAAMLAAAERATDAPPAIDLEDLRDAIEAASDELVTITSADSQHFIETGERPAAVERAAAATMRVCPTLRTYVADVTVGETMDPHTNTVTRTSDDTLLGYVRKVGTKRWEARLLDTTNAPGVALEETFERRDPAIIALKRAFRETVAAVESADAVLATV